MNIQAILKQLEVHTGRFPRQALKEAIRQQEKITPELLKIVEYATQNIDAILRDEDYMAHIYALYLLAQFREASAYPLIVKFVSIPGEAVMDITGDVVTEDLGSILASVSQGDTGLMKELIENKEANEYVRSATMNGMVTLVACGGQSREDVLTYFQSLLQGKLEPDHAFLWGALVYYSTHLYPDLVYEDIKQAFANDLVEESYIELEDVEETLERGKEETLKKLTSSWYRYTYIEDTIQQLESWAGFQPPKPIVPPPAFAARKKIGRNEPCPCGSGKKYKRCCGKRA